MGPRLTPQVFEDLAQFVEALLGEHLEKNLSRFKRAKMCGNTDFIPHRLAYLYDRMVDARRTTKLSPPSGDLGALTELNVFRSLVDEFKTEPGWSDIKSELNAPRSFAHLMNLLIFLKMQRGRNVNCGFVTSNSTVGKSADIAMFTPLKDRINVEIKAPEKLITPIDLSKDDTDRIIRQSWKKARKQLGNEASILVIGGLFIPKKCLDLLELSAQEFLDRKQNKNVAFIRIQSISLLMENPIIDGDKLAMGKGTNLTPQITLRQAKNNSYQNIVEFYTTNKIADGFSKSDENQKELTVEGDKIIRKPN